jgi:hypothetical protein
MLTRASEDPTGVPDRIHLIFWVYPTTWQLPGRPFALLELTRARLDWLGARGDELLPLNAQYPQREYLSFRPRERPGFFVPEVFVFANREEIPRAYRRKLAAIRKDQGKTLWRMYEHTRVPENQRWCVDWRLVVRLVPQPDGHSMLEYQWEAKIGSTEDEFVVGSLTDLDHSWLYGKLLRPSYSSPHDDEEEEDDDDGYVY